jgi:AcrR family transcriptional regulator
VISFLINFVLNSIIKNERQYNFTDQYKNAKRNIEISNRKSLCVKEKNTEQQRSRGRPRKFDEQAVLASALEVFRVKGFNGASLDDLTAATGLNRPSLYGAFGNKQALFAGSVEYYWQQAGGIYRAALFGGQGLRADLKALFAAQIDIITRNLVGGCIVACALPEGATEDADFMAMYRRIFAESDAVVRMRLKQAIEDGEISKSVDVKGLAGMIVNEVFGISLRARAGARPEELAQQGAYAVGLIDLALIRNHKVNF